MSKEHHAMMIAQADSEEKARKVMNYIQVEMQEWEILLNKAKAKLWLMENRIHEKRT